MEQVPYLPPYAWDMFPGSFPVREWTVWPVCLSFESWISFSAWTRFERAMVRVKSRAGHSASTGYIYDPLWVDDVVL